jgi:hypothetical protein
METQNPNPTMRDLAQQLLAYEAAAGQTPKDNTLAVFRVSEKLRLPLITLAGTAGFRALLTRALALTKAHTPVAAFLEVRPDGSLDGLSDFSSNGQAAEAGVNVIAQLLDLLVVFIGDQLVLRLVLDAWPDLPYPPAGKTQRDSKGT